MEPHPTSNTELLTTPITIAVHRKTVNPVFGEGAIHVSIEDEAAGPFVTIRNLDSDIMEAGVVQLELEELNAVHLVAKELIFGMERNCCSESGRNTSDKA